MSNPKGIITRKDIIEDEAINWGTVYSDNIKEAVKQNNILVESVKTLNKQVQAFKVANSQKDYITAKQAEALATQEAINAIKKQEAAEISADKVKKSAIATMEAERKAKQAVMDAETKAQKVKEASKKLTIEERVQNEINNKVLKQEALERLGLVSAYTKLNASRTEAKKKLLDLIASESASTAEIKKAQKEYDVLDIKVRKADAAVGDFTKNVGNYPFKNITSGLQNLIGAFGVTGGIAAFAGIMKGAYETTKKFEQGVADLSSITGATGKDLAFLKNQAIDLGKGVKGGAIAVVEAYKLIASAKPELLDNVDALNQVTEATIRLSQASGLELPEAATKLTDAMNQFGAPASEASKYVDVLAAGAKYGAAEIPGLTDAILEFGAVAKTSNVDIKESTALVELLAEKGQKGAEAGTKIRNILLQVMSGGNSKEARTELEKYGISINDLKDKSIPFAEKLEALKPLLNDVGAVTKVFGKENATAAISLIENTERLKELTKQVGEVGVADEQAAIRMDTLQGKTDKLSSTYDSLVLTIGKGSGVVSGFFKFFIDGADGALNSLIRLNASWDELYVKAAEKGEKIAQKTFDVQMQGKTGDNAEKQAESNIRITRNNLKTLADQIKETKKGIQEDSFAGAISQLDGVRKTKVGLQKDLEILVQNQAQYAKVMKMSKEFISQSKVPVVPESTGKPDKVYETDAERKKREAKEKKAAQDKLDLEKQLADSEYELQRQRLEQNIQFNNEIASDDKLTDDIRIQSALDGQKKQFDLLELTKNHLLDNDKLTADDRVRIEEDFSAKKIEVSKKTALEIDKINEFDRAKYQANLDEGVKKNEIAMNAELAAENERFKTLQDLGFKNDKEREDATKAHEQNLFDIKKEFAIATANLQLSNLQAELDAFKAQSDGSEKSNQIILETEKKLSDARLKLTELGLETFVKGEEQKAKSAKEQAREILQVSKDMTGALANLANAFSEQKLQSIDAEISANDEYYAHQIELAGDDARKKDLLQKEQKKKNDELEKKKREEQTKQAKFNKAIAIAQASINLALAITAALATAPPASFALAAITAVLAGIELAAVIATPIPKYKGGRKGGPAELAYVGDGGRHEIIERASGIIQMTPATDTLVKLEQDDIVHSSIEDYYKLQRAALLTSIDIQGRKVSDFQASKIFESHNKELVEEMRLTRKAIEKNKSNIIFNAPKLDINYHLWKMKNTNWN